MTVISVFVRDSTKLHRGRIGANKAFDREVFLMGNIQCKNDGNYICDKNVFAKQTFLHRVCC